jgi:hypothetical protein
MLKELRVLKTGKNPRIKQDSVLAGSGLWGITVVVKCMI